MKRRDFILNTSLLAFAISTNISCIIKREDDVTTTGDNCDNTTKDILGPFYREQAPERTNIREPNDTNRLLHIKGKVILNDCTTPVSNIYIDFWQANDKGEYDNESTQYKYRAKVKTNQKGEYELKTIMPGKYLNGNQFRPSHIHLRIKTDHTKELISQIYFKNDTSIDNDPWASNPNASNRILEMNKISEHEHTINFNIILEKA